eukprot:CAMPEP_0183333792 /NCGR_PEP_ID=MMETSP0164_2-20130417/2587_1 /TAXON_ID=221442 /ORGANISM="Coccolithus pelagicus ssp braarudi, Strain PLY182g" /LENGTH=64 /DNA_ID=CAMNT_0025502797 /DNA_START=768 /DNA_END=959 /DNA_ORIENTATION=-
MAPTPRDSTSDEGPPLGRLRLYLIILKPPGGGPSCDIGPGQSLNSLARVRACQRWRGAPARLAQ